MLDFNFRFFRFDRADLVRRMQVEGRSGLAADSWRVWLGVLSLRYLPVLLLRGAQAFQRLGVGPLAKALCYLNYLLFGLEISPRCRIGPGVYFPHTSGTVIGAWSIGENSVIFQGVTLGAKKLDFAFEESARPKVGANVTIGAGAKVLGGVVIGDNAQIGANAVVLRDVPPGHLAVGVPASCVPING
jgi:serine O-acetyltransferase